MKLQKPFQISARLMPALRIGDGWISLDLSGRQSADGRDIYDCWIDLPDGSEHEITDLRSGCQGGSVLEGFSSLLSFLGAAAESVAYSRYSGKPGENADLFSPAIVEWADANSDELSMLALELEETPDLITD